GTEDLLETITVHVGHGDVLVVHARAVARFGGVARGPTRTNGAVWLEHIELRRRVVAGMAHDDLEPAGVIQVRQGEGAEFPGAAEGSDDGGGVPAGVAVLR